MVKDKTSTTRVRAFKQAGAGYGKMATLLEEAITYMNAGRYGRSSAAIKELLEIDPHNMEARRLFATLHLRLGSLIPARQAFDSLIDEAFERQDYWLAESLLKEYLAAGPRCVPYLEKLGALYQNKGQILEAVAEYGKAIEILIEDPDPDDPARASRLYETIKTLAPASPVAIRLAKFFDVQTGELIVRQTDTEPSASPFPLPETAAATEFETADRTTPQKRSESSSFDGLSTQFLRIEQIAGSAGRERIASPIQAEKFSNLSSDRVEPDDISTCVRTEIEAGDNTSVLSNAAVPMNGYGSLGWDQGTPLAGASDEAALVPSHHDFQGDPFTEAAPMAVAEASEGLTVEGSSQAVDLAAASGLDPGNWSIELLQKGSDSRERLFQSAGEGGDVSGTYVAPVEAAQVGELQSTASVAPESEAVGVPAAERESGPSPDEFETARSAEALGAGEEVLPESPAPVEAAQAGELQSTVSVAPESEAVGVPAGERESGPSPDEFETARSAEVLGTGEEVLPESPAPVEAAQVGELQSTASVAPESEAVGAPAAERESGPSPDEFETARSAEVLGAGEEVLPESPAPVEQGHNFAIEALEAKNEGTTAQPSVEPTGQIPDWIEPAVASCSPEAAGEDDDSRDEVPPADGGKVSTVFSNLGLPLSSSTCEEYCVPTGDPPVYSTGEDDRLSQETMERHSAVCSATSEIEAAELPEASELVNTMPGADDFIFSQDEHSEDFCSPGRPSVEFAPPPPAEVEEYPQEGWIQREEVDESINAERKVPHVDHVGDEAKPQAAGDIANQGGREPANQPAKGIAPQGTHGDEQSVKPSLSRAAAAVDVLFEQNGRLAEAGQDWRAPVRSAGITPSSRETMTRIGDAVADFLSSCFSTTRAFLMSLIALVVLMGLVVVLGIGVVGVIWVMIEEPPSAAYQRLTVRPPHTLVDPEENGYLLLLGFESPWGDDPLHAGSLLLSSAKDAERAPSCTGDLGDGGHIGSVPASAKVLSGWIRGSDPIGSFRSNQRTIGGWIGQSEAMLSRYRRWQQLPFEDLGFGRAIALPCGAITFAHHLYVAEGFLQQTDIGVDRLEADMEAWRVVLAQARTVPVKTLAIQAVRDDAAVASGLLASPDFDDKYAGRLSHTLRPLSAAELSVRWPLQSELVWASKSFDAFLRAETDEMLSVYAALASVLPLPKQRRLNRYAAYYEASYRVAEEGRYGAFPKRGNFVRYPAETMTDYFTDPIENIIGLEPLPMWDVYHGMAVDADAYVRLAGLQAWIRRGSQDAELYSRIAKAGQSYYDPYTGLPMLVNLKKRVLYSVGQDGKDQEGDPRYDIVVPIPADRASAQPNSAEDSSMAD